VKKSPIEESNYVQVYQYLSHWINKIPADAFILLASISLLDSAVRLKLRLIFKLYVKYISIIMYTMTYFGVVLAWRTLPP
jgi:hypothetical protein